MSATRDDVWQFFYDHSKSIGATDEIAKQSADQAVAFQEASGSFRIPTGNETQGANSAATLNKYYEANGGRPDTSMHSNGWYYVDALQQIADNVLNAPANAYSGIKNWWNKVPSDPPASAVAPSSQAPSAPGTSTSTTSGPTSQAQTDYKAMVDKIIGQRPTVDSSILADYDRRIRALDATKAEASAYIDKLATFYPEAAQKLQDAYAARMDQAYAKVETDTKQAIATALAGAPGVGQALAARGIDPSVTQATRQYYADSAQRSGDATTGSLKDSESSTTRYNAANDVVHQAILGAAKGSLANNAAMVNDKILSEKSAAQAQLSQMQQQLDQQYNAQKMQAVQWLSGFQNSSPAAQAAVNSQRRAAIASTITSYETKTTNPKVKQAISALLNDYIDPNSSGLTISGLRLSPEFADLTPEDWNLIQQAYNEAQDVTQTITVKPVDPSLFY